MYIISKFHDYYDPVASNGIDKTCVYERKFGEKVFGDYQVWKYLSYTMGNSFTSVRWTKGVIGFCGELFPIIGISDNRGLVEKINYFYKAEDLLSFAKNQNISIKKKGYTYSDNWKIREIKNYGNFPFSINLYEEDLKLFFNKNNWKGLESQFVENKVPVFYFDDNKFISNPCLRDYGFQKIKDPYTAFQDIYMFLSGVLGAGSKETGQVPEKYRIEYHGFDKHSFRAGPKKANKRKKQ